MTVHEYRTSSRGMIRSAAFITCGTLISAATVCVYLLINLANFRVYTVLVIMEMIASGAFFLGIHVLEKRAVYQCHKDNDAIEGAIEI